MKYPLINLEELKTIYPAHLDPKKSKDMRYATVSKPYNNHYKPENLNPIIPEKTIYQMIWDNNKDYLDEIALVYQNSQITFREFFEEVENAAKGLKALGIKKGDVIAAALTSTPESIYLIYASSMLGVTFASIDPRDSSKELIQKLNDATPKCLFVSEEFNKQNIVLENTNIKDIITVSIIRSLPSEDKESLFIQRPELKEILEQEGTYNYFIKNGIKEHVEIEEYDEKHIAAMVYTGASTSNGKGVMLNDYSFNALGICQKNSDFPWERGKIFFNCLPQFIAYGVCNSLHVPLMYGEINVLGNPLRIDKFDEYLVQIKPNHIFCSPIHLRFLKNSSLITEHTDLSFLEMVASGGAGMPVEEDIENREFFESHGAKSVYGQGYGLSEVNAAFSYGRGEKNKDGFVGIPFAGNDAAIFNPDTFEEVPYGENIRGIVMIKTPTMMMGYFGINEEKNSDIFVKDISDNIWISPEDVMTMDDEGRLKIVDRQKRGFNCMGMNMYPNVIENVLSHHPAIYESTVVGISDPVFDKVPVANIVLKEGYIGSEEIIADELDKIIREELPDYTQIYAYNFRLSLPYTTRGKPDYRLIEQEAVEEKETNKVLVRKIKTPSEILDIKSN